MTRGRAAAALPSGVPQRCGGRYGLFLTGWCGGGRVAADASAQITELDADDHGCLTLGEREELFALTAAFVRDGLAAGLKVMWLSDAGTGPVITELTRRG